MGPLLRLITSSLHGQSCTLGFPPVAKESCWFSQLLSYLPPPLLIFPVMVILLVPGKCFAQWNLAVLGQSQGHPDPLPYKN